MHEQRQLLPQVPTLIETRLVDIQGVAMLTTVLALTLAQFWKW